MLKNLFIIIFIISLISCISEQGGILQESEEFYSDTSFNFLLSNYQGLLSKSSDSSALVTNSYSGTASPASLNLVVDAYFNFTYSISDTGFTNYPMYVYIENPNGEVVYVSEYLDGYSGSGRIWLNDGKGTYRVGLIADLSRLSSPKTPMYIAHWIVENTRDESGVFLYPTPDVNYDLGGIAQKAADLTSSIDNDYDKIKAIFQYVVKAVYYDMNSITDRKPQNAKTVYDDGLAVCSGYANLFAGMLRSLGIKTKVVESNKLNHAWNEVYYKGRWYLTDPTWGDPGDIAANTYTNGENISYDYFMLENLTPSDRDDKYDTKKVLDEKVAKYDELYNNISRIY